MAQTISVLADSQGLRSDTLRYYERLGLLVPAERSAAGYRLYDDAGAERLRFIRGLQQMGLRLAEIKELLEVRDRGSCPCGHTEVLVDRRLAELDVEIQRLKSVRHQLADLKRRNAECMDGGGVEWSCAIGIKREGEL